MSDTLSEGLSTLETLTDAELLRRFVREREEAAFEVLVHRHGSLVLGACRRVLQHAQDTEDAFQATFLVLARKAPTIQNYQSLAGWLYKVAYRIALRARAHRAQRQAQQNRLFAERRPAVSENRSQEIESLVDEEVQRLPEKYRTPVLLCYMQGQTNEEAAQQLRCPTGTVKIRLLRGREMLRKRLRRQGIAVAVGAWLTAAGTSAQGAASPTLLADTVRAGCELGAGARIGTLGLPAQVCHLAQSWFKRVALARVKVTGAVLLTLLLLALTDRLSQNAAAASVAAPAKPTPVREQREVRPPTPELESPSTPPSRLPEVFVELGSGEDHAAETH